MFRHLSIYLRWSMAVLLLAAGCQGDLTGEVGSGVESVNLEGGDAQLHPDHENEVMPPQLRRAWIAAQMADAGPAYNVREVEEDGLRRLVTAHMFRDMRCTFDPSGIGVGPSRSDQDDWHLEMAFVGIGREGRVQPVSEAVPAAEGNRVEYRRDGLTEWYLHGPPGLEQGFTIERRPAGNRGPLVLELEVRGTSRRFSSPAAMSSSFAT